jgi:type IV pilus assembly protein PilE
MASSERGFTLIEVMIVVVIVAILSAIAIPSYRDYVTRGRIVEATAGLGDARNKMEQYFQDNRTYPTACKVQPTAPGATEVQLQALQNFTMSCTLPAGGTTYTVTAAGNTGGPMEGFSYTINETNVRTTTLSGTGASSGWTVASPNTCWVIRKGGICS